MMNVPDGWKLVPNVMSAAMINAWTGGISVTSDNVAANTSFQKHWTAVLAAAPAAPVAAPAPSKSLNALVADSLRPFCRDGRKVIWRESFRWHDDNGVLSNHYDSMELDQLADDFDYEIIHDMRHAAVIAKRVSP